MPTVPPSWSGYPRPDPQIELQEYPLNGWWADEGFQWAELDSDWFGPLDPKSGEPASIAIYQVLSTVPSGSYELSFAYSPRPGVAIYHLIVKWDGNIVFNSGEISGPLSWTTPTYTVTASGPTTELRFEEDGPHDSLGMFLDDVRVIPLFVCVDIDIKPISYPNSFSVKDQGPIPVAIFGSADFDVHAIHPESITLGGAGVAERGRSGKTAVSYEDVNGDGIVDMVAFFSAQEVISNAPINNTPGEYELTLTGELCDGTAIVGTDSVRVVPL